MDLDYNSLLLSVGFSAAGLALAILGGWLLTRTEGFMLTWSIGLVLIVGNVLSYSQYVREGSRFAVGLSMVLLVLAFSTLYGAAVQFVRHESPLRSIALVGLPSVLLVLVPTVLGYDAIGLFAENLLCGLILLAIAVVYWRGRAEAPVPIYGVAVLYAVVGVSFLLCALMIARAGELRLAGPPDNWAEDVSLLACLIGMTGIGALSLALNQWRLAARHRQEALTDPLTGLANRRALFETFGDGPLPGDTVVIVFDLDRFKSINDRYGHALGDEVLRRFAETLVAHGREGDRAARLGGEEFALVLPQTQPLAAMQIAEHIRNRFEAERFAADGGPVTCTVSAGVAVALDAGPGFEETLSAADRALYHAKSAGRNRIAAASLLRAG